MLVTVYLSIPFLSAVELKREVAYVIRRYKPGKARSQYQVVVRRLNGSRKQVLDGIKNPLTVCWLDSRHLLWGDGIRVYDYSTRTQKSRLIGRGRLDTEVYRLACGSPLFTDWDAPKAQTYKVQSSGNILRFTPHEYVTEDGSDTFLGGDNKWHSLDNEPEGSMLHKANTAMLHYTGTKMLNNSRGAWIGLKGGRSTSENVIGLVYEDRFRRQKLIQAEMYTFSGDPNGAVLAYAPVPSIRMLGKLHLFMNELRICNWKTGQSIALESGNISVTSVSLRPQ